MSTEQKKTIKSHCNECLAQTNHEVLKSCKRDWTEEQNGQLCLVERMVYELVQCCGCENVSLRRTYSNAGQREAEVDYFPPAVARKTPVWMRGLDWIWPSTIKNDLHRLFDEVYSAVYSGNNCLAMMGMRAIIDLALNDKLGDVGGFAQKLDLAKQNGWITAIHHKTLKVAVEAGNAASHRAYNPETDQLVMVLDIVENLIQMLYVLESNAEKISKKTPLRPHNKGTP